MLQDNPELHIPRRLRFSHVDYIDGIPVAPLDFVLYHKLLGWDLRSSADEEWKRDQAHDKDCKDIMSICKILHQMEIWPLSKTHMGNLYLQDFAKRAEFFAGFYKGTARKRLQAIGFDV